MLGVGCDVILFCLKSMPYNPHNNHDADDKNSDKENCSQSSNADYILLGLGIALKDDRLESSSVVHSNLKHSDREHGKVKESNGNHNQPSTVTTFLGPFQVISLVKVFCLIFTNI